MIYSHSLETPLGLITAIEKDEKLIALNFEQTTYDEVTTPLFNLLQAELNAYFKRKLKIFTVPIQLIGTPFQHQAWKALTEIPYGEIRSYKEQAYAINKPSAFRAVASANKANPIAIIIPCHRIIRHDGSLCGYNGGIERKKWLLEHEKTNL